MFNFERYKRIAKLGSQHYASYNVLCHANSLRSAGWLLYRYAKNGVCLLEKVLYSFKMAQGETSRLEWSTNSRKGVTTTIKFQQQLPLSARSKVAQAAALSVCLDVRLFSLWTFNQECAISLKPFLKYCQSVPENETITQNSIYRDVLL